MFCLHHEKYRSLSGLFILNFKKLLIKSIHLSFLFLQFSKLAVSMELKKILEIT